LSLKNEVYFKTAMQAISKQYPDIPDWYFSNPKEWIHNYVQGASEAKIRSKISELGSSRGFKCDLSFQISSQAPLQVVHGTARTKKEADHVAYFNMVPRLHELGVLQSIVASLRVEQLDQQVLADEANAKMDIYNYAARFDAVPKIDFRVLPGRTPARKVVEFTVRLSELNIEVVRKGHGLKQAEIAVALHFKEAAEKHHAEHGDGSIIIKDSTALTTSNARKFFDYYKIVHPKVSVEVTSKQARNQRSLGDMPFLAQVLVDNEPTGEPVEMVGKRKAEDLAYLTAAIALKKREPELFPRFFRALKTGNGEILRPLNAIDMPLDDDAILVMRETLLSVRRAGLPDQAEEILSDEEISGNKRRPKRQLAPSQIEPRNFQLQEALSGYLKNPKLEQLRRKRSELPMNQYKAKVLDQVNHNTYSIIVGATGSGKTTQVPQILLEDKILNGRGATCNIICTQPRRIAATSVARRVAEERAQSLQNTVGYQVRFDARLPNPGGSITYCTTGILLQQLQNSPDEVMDSTSHLIIDEVHERDILIDFLLIILKKVMAHRAASGKSIPKVVLMSATMDTELFANYFKNNNAGHGTSACPALSVPGRTFPVKEKFLDTILKDMTKTHSAAQLRIMYSEPATRDYLKINDRYSRENAEEVKVAPSSAVAIVQDNDFVIDWKHEQKISAQGDIEVSNEKEDSIIPYALVATTIAHIAKTTENGAILVFLPGLDEMLKVDEWLRQGVLGVNFADTSKFKLSMLHSSIAGGHTEVFNAVPQGCRKIILATNIAETSITIPDVQYVVDTGKLREKQYDQLRRITKLQCTWISKSNSKQRAGRAGRVQDGNYYALFSRTRHNSLRAIGLPEILRSDLQEICLDIKAQAFKSPIREFLSEAIEPPAPAAVDTSVVNLQALDAITEDERITPLGRLLASLPVHPSLGKMIVLGVLFRCLDPMLILGAAAAERNIFVNPLEARGEAQRAKASFAGRSASDHIALLSAVREMRRIRDTKGDHASQDFAFKNFIHNNSFKVVDATARQIEEILVEAGLIPFTPSNARSNSEFGDPLLNTNSSKTPLVKALALAGLHPNLAVATGGRTFRTPGEKGTIVHPSSVNARDKGDEDRIRYGKLYSYSTMARSNDGGTLFLRDTSESTPLMATLFGGKLAQPTTSKNILEMDNWLPFYVQHGGSAGRAAKTVLEFRKALERLLAGAFRDLKVRKEGRAAEGARRAYLADETVRELFAEGLVEVLEKDVGAAKVGRGFAGEGENPGGMSRFANARKWMSKGRVRSERGDAASRYAISP
jgi:ATP-dependent RNA helicase DHX36